ncbi:helix-turn-helix transcriptional regulator [Clostridium sporogenes]|uniref:helix-turn-helix domain-containing protein n=1 Tax=Clostridium sporogenes TaxID=1509 RepID=UPI0013D29CBD|nr:helix-turn-helix transcriptional regulator [Clostridium sporogenes]NFQ83940.1 helix-turn-helix transcriptional regulator [Clostridium sporogenes]
MSIGENIKKTRKKQGLTQKSLAEKANISRSYLADVENNRYNPSIDVLNKIAKSLGITAQQLLKDNIDEKDDIDKMEEDLQILFNKIQKISPKDRKKLLQLIEIFEEDEH